MRFYEYESKALFARHDLPLSKSGLAHSREDARRIAREIAGPTVLKSQVLSGGRMKAGAVRFAQTPDEAAEHYEAIVPIVVNGQKCRAVLVEEKSQVDQEYYAGVTWDGRRKLPVVIFSDMGGIEIEQVAEKHPDHVSQTQVSTLLPLLPHIAKEAVSKTGVTGAELTRLAPIVSKLI
jgi:succinyl-CoA synthetase beta subunit